MSFPFFDAIKGTTAGTPGTGAFTPNAASSGFRAWSTVPAGWIGLVRFEDAAGAWELRFCYWSGTTVSRPTNGFHSSSSGSGLTLTSAATAALVVSADMVQPNIGMVSWGGWLPVTLATAPTAQGLPAATVAGTAATTFLANTNALTRQNRIKYTSATTANAQCGIHSNGVGVAMYTTTAGAGGFELSWRFGASTLPTSPRVFMGLNDAGGSFVGNTGNPSANAGSFVVFGKDSGDTNLQFMTNDLGVTAGKSDTGIPIIANGWYQASIWAPPGGGTIYGLLYRIDTGDIWYGSRTTDMPFNPTALAIEIIAGLSSSTGTSYVLEIGGVIFRTAL